MFAGGAAVFVESDETTGSENRLCARPFRRILLQIGGANLAGADRAFEARLLRPRSRTKARPLAPPQYGGRRDPSCVFLPYSPNSLASEILFAQHIETAECRGRVAYP